mgnify:CR=1 FL=1
MRPSIPTLYALILVASPLHPAAAQTSQPIVLEEVVVTALKRGASAISDTPIAISAFSGESLERQGADALSDAVFWEASTQRAILPYVVAGTGLPGAPSEPAQSTSTSQTGTFRRVEDGKAAPVRPVSVAGGS